MIYPTEQGCSMVFNKIAVSLYLSKRPSVAYHDRWMFFICYYLGWGWGECVAKTDFFCDLVTLKSIFPCENG